MALSYRQNIQKTPEREFFVTIDFLRSQGINKHI